MMMMLMVMAGKVEVEEVEMGRGRRRLERGWRGRTSVCFAATARATAPPM